MLDTLKFFTCAMLFGILISSLTAHAASGSVTKPIQYDGVTALVLVVNGDAATTAYYRTSYHCEEALKVIEAKAREARPKLSVFGVCTKDAAESRP